MAFIVVVRLGSIYPPNKNDDKAKRERKKTQQAGIGEKRTSKCIVKIVTMFAPFAEGMNVSVEGFYGLLSWWNGIESARTYKQYMDESFVNNIDKSVVSFGFSATHHRHHHSQMAQMLIAHFFYFSK